MNLSSLPFEDLPPDTSGLEDTLQRLQLEEMLAKYFYDACHPQQQALLSNCEWYITTYSEVPTLIIECPDQIINWRVLKSLVTIGGVLKCIVKQGKIRVTSPASKTAPFEMRVDELPVYRYPDLLS
ncbi:hypothetical protein ACE1B6_29000 [Aerosakkonemataceae cyanobacterium BLCC-F154]|uniref:Uncharacterized protein n=1 Tax=Floridaenema fluviatile BLCC-F154 TaxID=3153640 RepID=A0ABV4YKF8_9CYAN